MSIRALRSHRITSLRNSSRKAVATLLLALMPVQAMASTAPSAAGPSSAQPATTSVASSQTSREILLFGPQRYVRTNGPADVTEVTIQVPAWVKAPFRLHVQNGEPDGTYRVSSGTITVDGASILTQADFKQTAAAYDREVTLKTGSKLTVTLTSKPTSYLLLSLFATSDDYTAPTLALSEPVPGSTINTATPRFLVRYDDIDGAGEPAASGVDINTLRVSVDGVDRTALFVRRSNEASADWPRADALPAGRHTFSATIADFAGNRSEATGEFQVDLQRPAIKVAEPAPGAYLRTQTPAIRITYSDETALDLDSLHVNLGTMDLTPYLNRTASQATVVWPDGVMAPEGPHQLTATIRDRGGNESINTAGFNLDVTPPRVAIAQPIADLRIGSRDISVTLTWSDDQAIAPATAKLTLDGNTVAIDAQGGGGTAQLTGVTDGLHDLAVTIADRAGNNSTAAVSFTVDTTVPKIEVTQPPAGALIKTNVPDLSIRYSDEQGVDPSTLKITINSEDHTALVTAGATEANGAVRGFTLPEGSNVIGAEVKDLTDNVGSTVSEFIVDTVAPAGTIEEPGERTTSSRVTIAIRYSDDSGTGVDPSSVRLAVDATDRSALVRADDSTASATIAQLTDGTHEAAVTFADRAGNETSLTKSFFVDTRAPQLMIVTPGDDAFIRARTPALRVTYSDNGTGVDNGSFKAMLQQDDEADRDVTAWFTTVTASEARGAVPADAALADGTYHLHVTLSDVAGNVASAETAFEVDTVAPTYRFDTPAPGGYLASATPSLKFFYDDSRSGVDTSRTTVEIDHVDRSSLFTFENGVATGAIPSSSALTEGTHTIAVTLLDRAGNVTMTGAQPFTVDLTAPTAAIAAPLAGSYIGKAPHALAVEYQDASGIDPASVRITLDGADVTTQFAIAAATATASIATQLADGEHTIDVSVLDWAGNEATASSQFTVDSVDPVVTVASPAAQAWMQGPTITVTGSVDDASPTVVEVNGLLASVAAGSFTAAVPAEDGALSIEVVATDAAGNRGTATIEVSVDSLPPSIEITEPAAGLVTNQSSVRIAGSVTDASPVTMTLNGQPLAHTTDGFATDVTLAVEGENRFTIAATDSAGLISSVEVMVVRDTIAPSISVTSPLQSSIVGNLPLSVSGTWSDATAVSITVDGIAAELAENAWQSEVPSLVEGPHTLVVVITDAAGNSTSVQHDVMLDLEAPVVAITSPDTGMLTSEATVVVSGTATDVSLASVVVGGVEASLSAGATEYEKQFTATVPLSDGDNSIHVVATDAIDRTTDVPVLVTRDSTPPFVTVEGPDQITRSAPVAIVAAVTDNLAVRDVVFSHGDVELARVTAPPFTIDFSAPASAAIGETLTLTIVATDTAGNTASVEKSLKLVAEGALTGQVLSDVTGQPIAGARVRLLGSQPKETSTDERGRYAFAVNDQNAVIAVDADVDGIDTLIVERVVAIQSGVGTVPVDARLTPLGSAISIGSAGGTLTAGTVTVKVPSGAVASATPMHLTSLSPQGLPNLLPLGWAPVATFDLTIDGALAVAVPFAATVSSTAVHNAHLLSYATDSHAWTMAQPGLATSDGTFRFSFSGPGTYALAVTDDAAVPVAAAGELVTGVEMQPIPDTATSSGAVDPPTLPPTGGSATGTLIVRSPTPLPSGTIVEAEVTETFSLASGETASEEKRSQDLVLNRAGSDLAATFPIVPARSFTGSELVEGTVHLDILAGREAVRGKTGGGTQAVTLTGGAVTVTIPAGSLPEDVAIAATPAILSTYLPATDTAIPFAEVLLDFSGFTLAESAELSTYAAAVGAGDTVVIGRVERVAGIPQVAIVAAADRVGETYVSRDLTGFDGIRKGGRYVFYRLTAPWSTIHGNVGLGLGENFAVVRVGGLPFVALTNAQGQFSAIAPVGSVIVTASIPGTSLSGSATVNVVAGTSSSVSMGVDPVATTATVVPQDGAIRVPVSVQIEITASAPLDPQTAGGVQLRDAAGQRVTATTVLSGSGRVLAVVPASSLQPGQSYTVTVSGLRDIYGSAVSAAPVSFTTQFDTPPSYDTENIVFTMPDAVGMVRVTAPAGSLPAGTRVMIVNAGNGVAVSYTVANDGSFSGEFPASISDRLIITITDPKGNVSSFEKSTYVATDGSGRVGIGRAGGRVEGTNGTAIIIPDGALEEGAVFKVEYFGPEKFPERPAEWDGAQFGGGLTIISEQMPKLREEGKLVFPLPAGAGDGAFFYVIKRMTGPGGRVDFATIDHAFLNADGKVETASYPFVGWDDSVDAWDASSTGVGFGLAAHVNFMLMWTQDALRPGIALPGMIVGKAYQLVYKPGQKEPVYEPVDGAMISAVDETGHVLWDDPRGGGVFATGQTVNGGPSVDKKGTFSLWDWRYTGGTVRVHGMYKGQSVIATAYEANPVDTKTFFSTLFMHYRNVANVNIVFAADNPATTSEVETHLMTLGNDNVRREVDGITPVNTPLLIGFKFKEENHGEITSATVNDEPVAMRVDSGEVGTGLKMDYLSSAFYTPSTTGTHTIRTTVINPLGGPVLEVEHTFLVVAGGGNNGVAIDGPPDWISSRLVPQAGQRGVLTEAMPQIVFTEPVTNVVEGIKLTNDEGDVPFTLSGIALDSKGYQYVVADMNTVSPAVPVTSVTLRPLGGLAFSRTYTLRVTDAVRDLDKDALGNATPHAFVAKQITFDTIRPEALGSSTEKFEASRVAVYDGYAYIGHRQPTAPNGLLDVYDVAADPQLPAYVTSRAVSGQPLDVVFSDPSPDVNGGHPSVLVGSGIKITIPGPSNFYMFDVADPKAPKRVGVVSLTESAEDGTVLRLFGRKRYAYAITYPKGIQVIDMKIAYDLHKKASENPYEASQMSKAIVTAGVGFGQDAIVATIPVRQDGKLPHLFDLAAGDYIVGGVNRTLVYATGTQPPLAIIDTVDAQVKTWTIAPTANGMLSFGRALALTRIANRDLLIVAGTGQGRPDGTGGPTAGPVLLVYDLSTPLVPNLIGSYLLPKTPTDLVVRGTTAFVGTDSGARVFSLAEPTRPRFLGVVTGTGPRLTVLNEGLIVSTAPDASMGGVNTAVYKPFLVVKPADAIQVLVDGTEGTLNNPQKVKTNEPRKIIVQIVPNVSVSGGKLEIRNQRLTDYQDDVTTADLTFDDKGEAPYTIASGLLFNDRDLRLTATAQALNGAADMKSTVRRVKLGWAKLTIDSNNNARLDEEDDEAKRKGKVMGFWEADPGYTVRDNFANDKVKASKGLSDYMTVRITANRHLGPGDLLLQLKRTFNTTWYLAVKKQPGTAYLSAESADQEQLEKIASVNPCDSVKADFDGECQTKDFLPLPEMEPGEHEFLLRCSFCPSNPADFADKGKLRLVSNSNGFYDEANVDIRPMEQWMSIRTVRQQTENIERPRSFPIPEIGWATEPQQEAQRITYLVHGYNVPFTDAIETFKVWTKRLYWAGVPVLRRQGSDWKREDVAPGCAYQCAHVIALSWPGDIGGPYPLIGLAIGPMSRFPSAEFRAFESGVPFAADLRATKAANPQRTIDVIAHSAGNIVTNSALQRLGESGIVDRYIMYEAAFAAEAYDGAGPAAPTHLLLDAQATNDAFSQLTGDVTTRFGAYPPLWADQRPDPPLADESIVTQRGPWKNFFHRNLDYAEIWNTYNEGDMVLQGIWIALGLADKPLISTMDMWVGDWWKSVAVAGLEADEPLFGSPAGSVAHLNTLLQWRDLSFYFWARTRATGAIDVPVFFGRNVNHTKYGTGDDVGFFDTHSYMQALKLPRVWGAWDKYREILQR